MVLTKIGDNRQGENGTRRVVTTVVSGKGPIALLLLSLQSQKSIESLVHGAKEKRLGDRRR